MKNNNEPLLVDEVQKLQLEALRRARNLKRIPKFYHSGDIKGSMMPKSHEKMLEIIPQKGYSIEKAHENHEIDFMNQFLQTKELTRKMCIKLKLEKFSFHHIIGSSIFGKVYKAEDRNNHKLYAIKELSKSMEKEEKFRVISKKGISAVMNEREIVTQLSHHLIPNLVQSFQTTQFLYFVLPLMEKGDLRYHIAKYKEFEEKEVRFFVACIVSVLEYLHKNGVVHRDIKPENLLLDQTGYLHVTDFGIAQKTAEITHGRNCGTPAYMAPEVIFEKEYGLAIDFSALGVIIYEMMIGERPFRTSNKEELKLLMGKHSAHIKKDEIPDGWSIEAADFANKLLHRNPQNRLGSNNINEMRNHPWLIDFPWEKLEKRQLISPYCEPFNHWEVDYQELFSAKNKEEFISVEKSLERGEFDDLFNCFTYDGFEKSMEYTTKPSLEFKN